MHLTQVIYEAVSKEIRERAQEIIKEETEAAQKRIEQRLQEVAAPIISSMIDRVAVMQNSSDPFGSTLSITFEAKITKK